MENKILENQISIVDFDLAAVENEMRKEDTQVENERESFIIDSLEKASWAMKKLREFSRRENQIKVTALNERAIIDNWEKEELKGIEGDKGYFEMLLKQYFERERMEDKKFKLSTPWGKVTSRKSKKWNWSNEEEIKKFIKENSLSDLIRIKEEINKVDFKKIFPKGIDEETGEIIQGLTIDEVEEVKVIVEV